MQIQVKKGPRSFKLFFFLRLRQNIFTSTGIASVHIVANNEYTVHHAIAERARHWRFAVVEPCRFARHKPTSRAERKRGLGEARKVRSGTRRVPEYAERKCKQCGCNERALRVARALGQRCAFAAAIGRVVAQAHRR